MDTRRWFPLLGLALLASAPAGAVTVHTWVDEQGVTHFSDAPPGGAQPSSEVQVQEAAPAQGAGGSGDYYSIVNQWQRMREEREQQDALELERERLDAARPPPPPTPGEMASEEAPTLLYPYPYPYPGPHHRHGYPPGPLDDYTGPPSSRNSFVNTKPPTWPRER